MTDWVPIILTALGSGALGSIITTYGTQTRERRQARTQARDAIRRVQNLTFPVPTQEQLTAALDNLETSAMLARLPKKLTSLNREALYIRRNSMASVAEPGPPDAPEFATYDSEIAFASQHIAAETLQLLVDATWPLSSAHLTAGGALASSPVSWTHVPGQAPAHATSTAGNANHPQSQARNEAPPSVMTILPGLTGDGGRYPRSLTCKIHTR